MNDCIGALEISLTIPEHLPLILLLEISRSACWCRRSQSLQYSEPDHAIGRGLM